MKTCFVISSIGSKEENNDIWIRSCALLDLVIKPVLEKQGYEVIRADAITAPNNITKDIVKHLERDTLVIADVHDRNPNVFYELGLRNAVDKPYILIRNPGQRPPFDIHQNRAIEHPFPEDPLDKENLDPQKNPKIVEIKETLKKFVTASEKYPKDASESIASESIASTYLKLTGLKKQFRTYVALFAAAIVIISIVLLLSISMITGEYEQRLLEKQTNSIKSIISHNIQTSIDSSNLFTVMIANEYNQGEDISEFLNGIKADKNLKIFAPDFRSAYTSAYIYLMEPGPKCEFIQYAYLEHMERIDGSLLESCYQTNDSDLYLTSVYPSTGTTDFVIALARTADFDPHDASSFDLIAVTAIDLSKFSSSVKNLIDMENVRFVLEDRKGQLVLDCDIHNCFNYKNYALNMYHDKTFDENSKPLTYDPNKYDEYKNHDDIFLSSEGLTNYDPQNSVLLEGWILHVFYK